MKKRLILFLFVGTIWNSLANAQTILTFQDALKVAMYNNFNILIARTDYKIAVNENIIGNAGMLPRIDVVANQNNSILNTELKFFSGETAGADNAQSSSLGAFVQLNWTVFDGFNMFATKAQLNEIENLGKYEMLFRMELVAAEIASVYYRLVQETKYKEILHQTLELSNNNLELSETRFSLGSESELERLNTLVVRNQDSSAYMRQVLLIKNLKADLNILLGRAPDLAFEIEEAIPYSDVLIYDDLKSDLSIQNNAMLAARAQANAMHKGIEQARSVFYPRIDLFGAYNYNTQQNEVGILQNFQSIGPSFGVSLSWNIFNGFSNLAEVRTRKMMFENAEYNRKQVDLEAQAALYRAYNDYEMWRDILKLEQINLEAARENVRVAKAKLDLGGLNEVEFRVIQLISLDAEFRLFLAEYQVRVAEIELIRLSGRLAKFLSAM